MECVNLDKLNNMLLIFKKLLKLLKNMDNMIKVKK